MATERFEDKLMDVLECEVRTEIAGAHLTRRDVRRFVTGRIRVREANRLGEHLACCAECRVRYDEARALEETPRPGWLMRLPSSRRATLLRYAAVAFVVLAVVGGTMLLTRQRGPAAIALQSAATARGSEEPASSSPQESVALSPEALVATLRSFSAYPAHRAAAYTIGLLRTYGVPLTSSRLAFDAATIFVAESGDSWESVAQKALGDAALWPIVVLLNLELTQAGEFVPAGTYLRVPLASSAGVSP